ASPSSATPWPSRRRAPIPRLVLPVRRSVEAGEVVDEHRRAGRRVVGGRADQDLLVAGQAVGALGRAGGPRAVLLLQPVGNLLRVADLLADQGDDDGVGARADARVVRVVAAALVEGLLVGDAVVVAEPRVEVLPLGVQRGGRRQLSAARSSAPGPAALT